MFTGYGQDGPADGDWVLFANQPDQVWAANGEAVYLRKPNGHLLDVFLMSSLAREPVDSR